MEKSKESKKDSTKLNIFEKEIARLPSELKSKLISQEKYFKEITDEINKASKELSMGFYITPEIEVKNNVPSPNFDKLTLYFLLDDFENPIPVFNAKFLLGNKFNELLIEEVKKDEYGQDYSEYSLKKNKNIKFVGNSISALRENCFDAIYDDMKAMGSSFIYQDSRGFISALKTIDIHRNMILQKFEKYIVVYAGAGSWLRGEKSNDFDVFVVVDDTDVKRMPRAQVKDQLTRILWQMSREVAEFTGIQLHIQVYLLTDFWDALKDAHPVMFTFLRDGVPFYDRGIYSAWKELLKLGKIRPSAEAIDMHMNVGTQLVDRVKKVFSEIFASDIYNAVLSPSQAILMLKGYNPTTPKETVKMFKEVLLAKEKSVSKQDVDFFENVVKTFKKIEHDKDAKITGKDLDDMISGSERYLKNIKKMFEEITEDRTKESIISTYSELLNQIRTLSGFSEIQEKDIFKKFEVELIKSGKIPAFVKDLVKSLVKAKSDYEKGTLTITEVNKVLKGARNVLTEIKEYKNKILADDFGKKRLQITYDKDKTAELINYDSKNYLIETSSNKGYELDSKTLKQFKLNEESFSETYKYGSIKLSEDLIKKVKKALNTEEIYL